jgi:hypothetical protein
VFGREKRRNRQQAPSDQLAEYVLGYVRDDDGRARVEDYLAALAAATGEAAILASGLLDIERNDLTPGSGVFGDAINAVLSGDVTEAPSVVGQAPLSVVGLLVSELVPDVTPISTFDVIPEVYAQVAAAVSVGADHQPFQPPLRSALELRTAIEFLAREEGIPDAERYRLCTAALAAAIRQTAGVLDPAVAVRLSLEICFGVAKLVPVPRPE